jgi:hypothetical protein
MRLYSVSVNSTVKRGWLVGALAAAMLVSSAAYAETSGADANPYAIISDRNVFHLNPEPIHDDAPPPKPPDLPKVLLSGFQKVGERLKVYLAIPSKDPKETTAYLALQVGEKENDVEIVKVREEKGEVDILNTGTPMTLTLASNGVASASSGAGGGGPSRGGPATGGPPGIGHRMMPGMSRPNMPAAASSAPAQAYTGGSAIVIGGSDNGGSSGSFGGGSSAYGNSGGVSVSGGGSYGGAVATTGGSNPSAQIANALFNNTGQPYHIPTQDNIVPAPPEVQAAGLLLNEKAGGPPSPYQEEGGGPPSPGQH